MFDKIQIIYDTIKEYEGLNISCRYEFKNEKVHCILTYIAFNFKHYFITYDILNQSNEEIRNDINNIIMDLIKVKSIKYLYNNIFIIITLNKSNKGRCEK